MKPLIPTAVANEIQRQAKVRAETEPEVLLPEDRESFLANLPPEHQVEGKQEWHDAVDHVREQTEAAERLRRMGAPTTTSTQRYFLTVRDVANRWNLSVRSIWRLIKSGELPSCQFGAARRVLEADVEAYENTRLLKAG